MKNQTVLFCAGLLLAAPALAKTRPIHFESYTYPSKAKIHLDIVQRALANEAIKACGNRSAVVGIEDFEIDIRGGNSDRTVGLLLDQAEPGLMLFYPHIRATAIAVCAD